MPFLRVVRDRRGYETTYLMHWFREGPRQRSKILYVFRTPGGVRVGRDALEPAVLRQLEAQHPDIAFDWDAVRQNQQMIEAAEPRRRGRRAPGDAERPGTEDATSDAAGRSERPRVEPTAALPAVPSKIEGDTPEAQREFLLQWYERIRTRIRQKTADVTRQQALFALAERLNPSAWTDADEITAGLLGAAEAIERLSHVFAKRRRRARRPSPRSSPLAADTDASEGIAAHADEAGHSDAADSTERGSVEPPDS